MLTGDNTLNIRQVTLSDLEELRVWSNGIKIPDIDDPLSIVSGSIFDNDNLLGAGFIKLVGEATIVLNPSLSIKQKSEILRLLFAEGRARSYLKGLDKLVAFTANPLYARLLKKRFDFDDNSGIGLQLKL